MPEAIVIGAGLGGLAAAVRLGAMGLDVLVLEAASGPGGKAGTVVLDGVEVDTGPSVLTMPDVLEDLFEVAGSTVADHLSLRRCDPGFRYLFGDGTELDVFHDLGDTLDSVHRSLGTGPRRELEAFLAYAGRIWEAAAPHFVYGASPSIGHLASLGLSQLADLRHIDPLRTMRRAINGQVQSPHLRMLLERYATYNGSDPRSAPATLNCIAHVELALGGYGVEGGVACIARSLEELARSLGVAFSYDQRVSAVLRRKGRVHGVELSDGLAVLAPVVVANADAAHVATELLGDAGPHGLKVDGEPSMSGWNGVVRAARRARVPHTVLFCEDYGAEFADIFDGDRPPEDPTVYLCAQEPCHGRVGWAEEEPLFLMVNAPAEPVDGPRSPEVWEALQERVLGRCLEAGLVAPGDQLVWSRTPADLARAFPGSRGSIYGAASNSTFSAFRRPANRVGGLPGLYLASGSAHPGGGMPLALLSGRAAAEAIAMDAAADLGPLRGSG